LGWLALGFALGSVGSFALTNVLPFDSFSIAWERKQVGILALHYLALALPFFCSGASIALLLSAHPQTAARTYFINLLGSASGCLLALLASAPLGGPGVVFLSSALALLATLCFWSKAGRARLLPIALLLATLTASLLPTPYSLPPIHLSPYKDLSYALNTPGAKVLSRRWNAFSRVDVVQSDTIRSLPGLSYRYPGLPPRQLGLTVDGGDLSAIVTDLDDLGFAAYMPGALAYHLRPAASALLLGPHGGLDILVAHAQGAQSITAVEPNPLVVQAARAVYDLPGVQTVVESGRSYARRAPRRYDLATLCLGAPYRPVRSGAYSLAEDYAYTVEAFDDYLALLQPGGIFQATRWLQTPPSEETRLFALALTALQERQVDPRAALLMFRGYNTATVLVKPDGFTPAELDATRQWLAERSFDLVYAPDIRADEVNRYNKLPAPAYYQAAVGLLAAPDRDAWYDAFDFDVRPPSDDHPFFGHYFKWRQAGQVWQQAGLTWQPFGGAGYFVLLALLALALLAALLVIVLPLLALRPARGEGRPRLQPGPLLYFGLIGLGYLLVEIPLAQRFMLFLGQPVYGLTAVLFALLLFSGLGSWASPRLPQRGALAALVLVAWAYPVLLPPLFDLFLGAALALRVAVAIAALAPLGFLLGAPLPQGVAWLQGRPQAAFLVPWAWGVNGAASVIASVGAALLALSWGFAWVLACGALCYAGAFLVIARKRK
jgi:spermidine synthase